MNRLEKARRNLERLKLKATGATKDDVAIRQAEWKVLDAESAVDRKSIRAAKRSALGMDVALFVVAALTMFFSLGNVRQFALAHGIADPLAWVIAPAVDVALIAALAADAFLSRHQIDPGPWAKRLRIFPSVSTLTLNAWVPVSEGDVAGIILHSTLPILLIILGESAVPYRFAFTQTVQKVAEERSRAVEEERSRLERERQVEKDRERAEEEERERREEERREREAEVQRQAEREEREHQERMAREQREHEAAVLREQRSQEDEREEWERLVQGLREQLEGAQAQLRERSLVNAASVPRKRSVSASVNAPKMPEEDAVNAVREGALNGDSVRMIASRTGWSTGWVSERMRDAS